MKTPSIAVSLDEFTPPNEIRRVFADQTILKISEIVNDVRFQNAVHQAKYIQRRFQQDSGEYVDATNGQILNAIISGKEFRQPADGTINLKIKLKPFTRRRTIGGMTPPDPLVSTNIKFFKNWMAEADVVSLAAHWLHEWMHVAGFRHITDSGHPNDVNYTIGRLAVEIGRQLLVDKGMSTMDAAKQGEGYLQASEAKDNCVII